MQAHLSLLESQNWETHVLFPYKFLLLFVVVNYKILLHFIKFKHKVYLQQPKTHFTSPNILPLLLK